MGCILVNFLVMVTLMAQAKPEESIIGKWKAVRVSDHGYKTMEFADHGLLSVSLGVEGTQTYTVEGKFIHFDDPELGPEVCEFRIENDTLFLKSPQRNSKLTRLDKESPNAQSIVGKWAETLPSTDGQGNLYVIEFNKNGRSTSSIEYVHGNGSYQISGDLITLSLAGETTSFRYRIEKGFLIFTSENKRPEKSKFRRIK